METDLTNKQWETLTDGELVGLIRSGDNDAFTVLLQRYMPVIRARARRFASAAGLDPEDLAQEAMLTLFRAVRGYVSESGVKFSTYAGAAIHHTVLAYVKRHMRSPWPEPFPDLDEHDFDGQDLRPVEDAFLEAEDSRMRIMRIETLLSVFERRVLGLYLSGYSYRQISGVLNSTTKAVDNALQRVRRKLRPDT